MASLNSILSLPRLPERVSLSKSWNRSESPRPSANAKGPTSTRLAVNFDSLERVSRISFNRGRLWQNSETARATVTEYSPKQCFHLSTSRCGNPIRIALRARIGHVVAQSKRPAAPLVRSPLRTSGFLFEITVRRALFDRRRSNSGTKQKTGPATASDTFGVFSDVFNLPTVASALVDFYAQ